MKTTIEIKTDGIECNVAEIGRGEYFEFDGVHYIKISTLIGVNLITGNCAQFAKECLVRPAVAICDVRYRGNHE